MQIQWHQAFQIENKKVDAPKKLILLFQEDEGKLLVRNAIAAGIFNDLGSGSNIDLCVIRRGSVDYLRPYDQANLKGQK